MRYSFIIPAYNEQENIPTLSERLNQVAQSLDGDTEILFVNDGSSDRTQQICEEIAEKNSNVKVLELSRNFGKQSAIFCGLEYASGEAVILLDADLQHPPELIPQMVTKWKEGYDIVYTIRERTEKIGFFRKLASALFYRVYRFLADTKIPANTPDFRLLDRKVLQVLRKFREKKRFFSGIIGWLGFKQAYIKFSAAPRKGGSPKFSRLGLVSLAIDAMTSFSIIPLIISFYLGFVVSFFTFIYFFYALVMKLFTDVPVSGWASTIMSVLFLGGVQLMVLGVIGKYIGLIYEEIRDRPYFIVSKEVGFKKGIDEPETKT